MVKAIVYPYNVLVTEFMRYRDLIEKYEIVAAVSPQGIGSEGIDCSFLDNGEETGILITHDFEEALDRCDTVIIAEYKYHYFFDGSDFESVVYERAIEAMKKGKNVISMHLFKQDELLYTEAKRQNVHYECVIKAQQIEECYYNENPDFMSIYKIDVPVITIVGLHEETNKFGIQLALRKLFLQTKLNVLQIGTKPYCEFFGFHSIPIAMLDGSLSEERKIIYFNHFVYNLVKKEMPDIIILGIPGGIVPISMRLHQHFGLLAYEIGCAIQTDYTILTVPLSSTENLDLDEIKEVLISKLGSGFDCIAMSNNSIDNNDLFSEYRVPTYIRKNKEDVDKMINNNKSGYFICSAVSNIGRENIFRDIIERWSELFIIRKDQIFDVDIDSEDNNIKGCLQKIIEQYFGSVKDLSKLMPYEYLYLHAAILEKFRVAPTKEQIESGCYYSIDKLAECISVIKKN